MGSRRKDSIWTIGNWGKEENSGKLHPSGWTLIPCFQFAIFIGGGGGVVEDGGKNKERWDIGQAVRSNKMYSLNIIFFYFPNLPYISKTGLPCFKKSPPAF